MKLVPVFWMLLLLPVCANGQLKDIFRALPDSLCLSLSDSHRQELIQHKTTLVDGFYRMEVRTLDENNGYMQIGHQADAWRWEMCYWKSDKGILVAVTYIGCGPMCHNEYLQFFFFEKNKVIPTKINLPNFKLSDFFEPKMAELYTQKESKTLMLVYELPQQGLDIRVRLEGDTEPYKPKHTSVLLVWQPNHTFKAIFK
ncbi:MAG: DUF3256 family protein [Raineya sp.]|jgi:hypothetical protein|nr:DUF3256 family protein [Raineya sp.]